MPATAGRVRMPANNRVHSSAALQTHGIWQSAIGYDPYAPTTGKDASKDTQPDPVASSEPGSENAYASFQGLLALARITGSNADETRGACRKCGRVGHLTFQCRNFLSVKEDEDQGNGEISAVGKASAMFEKIKKRKVGESEDEEEEEEEESESEDSDVDSEMERIIAERYGVKKGKKEERGRSKKPEEEMKRRRRMHRDSESDDDDDDDDEEERRKSRKEKRRRRSHNRRRDSNEELEEEGKKHKRHGHWHTHRRHRRREDSESEEEERRARRKSRTGRRKEEKNR